MAIRIYDATVKRIDGDVMIIKVDGGSQLVVPAIEEADRTTPLTVFMEPGQKTVKQVMLKRRFNLMTQDDTHHTEHTEPGSVPDVLDADVDLHPELGENLALFQNDP